MPLTRVDGDFTQVSNIVRVTVPLDTDYLLQEDGFSILQEDGFFILLSDPDPLVTVNHTLVANGGAGSGAQEPYIAIFFCENTQILAPGGALRVEGGGLGYADALLFDGVLVTNTDNIYGQYGQLVPGEWMDLIPGAVNLHDYEVRQTTVSGADPTGSVPPGVWGTFDFGDLVWGFDSIGVDRSGVWQFDVRHNVTHVIELRVVFEVAQFIT